MCALCGVLLPMSIKQISNLFHHFACHNSSKKRRTKSVKGTMTIQKSHIHHHPPLRKKQLYLPMEILLTRKATIHLEKGKFNNGKRNQQPMKHAPVSNLQWRKVRCCPVCLVQERRCNRKKKRGMLCLLEIAKSY